ncbi:hypothetical protein MDA_GLEAN10022584 [Myotis davidii]|uniref:Uncharacterized protein n=1 Tax=Myotis davidii TaxID=225400 RepID=L5M0X6_MYODS|nr:hypothetical protein MDA_GLEAN10022584 [Myotis davidii]
MATDGLHQRWLYTDPPSPKENGRRKESGAAKHPGMAVGPANQKRWRVLTNQSREYGSDVSTLPVALTAPGGSGRVTHAGRQRRLRAVCELLAAPSLSSFHHTRFVFPTRKAVAVSGEATTSHAFNRTTSSVPRKDRVTSLK